MTNDLVAGIQEAAAREFPKEACGYILDVGKKSVVFPCRNISRTPEDTFMIGLADYQAASKIGRIIGIWHSHPKTGPAPSPADLAACENSALPWYIVAVRKSGEQFSFQGPTVTQPSGFEMPYLGRPYVEGIFDCYGLVCDFYKREFKIELTNYARIEDDGRMGYTRFVEFYEREGFKRLSPGSEPKRGDLFFMQLFEDVPNHVALYLGDGMILHHNRDRLSKRDVYGGYWAKCTTHHLRHQSQC